MKDNEVLFPDEVVLEVTNKCNLKCRHCHFHSSNAKRRRSIGDMPEWVWRKVLEEIESWPSTVSIVTHGAGEPLLYGKLRKLLKAAIQLPNSRVGFMTNGMLLDSDWSRWLVENRVDFVFFSIDGVDPKTHDDFRVNADLKKIENNVAQLVEEKNKQSSELPLLSFNMVGYPEILDQEDSYVRQWIEYAESISIARFRAIGSRKLWKGQGDIGFRACPLLWSQAVVSHDGRVGLCCEDINLDVQLGELKDSSLADIFNNDLISAYRAAHQDGDVSRLNLCADCHSWSSAVELRSERLEINEHGVSRITTPASRIYRKERLT